MSYSRFQTEQEIFDAFSNPEFVDKLISYLSLEDRKGKDKFNVQRFVLFKVLCPIFFARKPISE